jgi:hypothetical protein
MDQSGHKHPGIIAGLVAEPIKGYIQESHKRKALRRLIYRDLAYLEYAMKYLRGYSFHRLQDPGNDIHFGVLRTDLFDWAFGSSKETFYRLEEAQSLIVLCGKIRSVAATEPADEASYQQSCAKMETCLLTIGYLAKRNVLKQRELDLARSKQKDFEAKFDQQGKLKHRSD